MKRDAYDVLDLKALRCFYMMAKHGSITQAGIDLDISDAAVSQRLKALERYLGVKLYESRGGRVRLTAAGERAFSLAASVFDEIDEFENAIGQGVQTGEVSMAANDAIFRYLLPGKLEKFYRTHPLASIRLVTRPVEETIQLIRANECDLGVIAKRKLPNELMFQAIGKFSSCLITPKGHPLAKRARNDFNSVLERQSFMGCPLIVLDKKQEGRRLDEKLMQLGMTLKPSLEVGSVDTLKYFVARGFGIAVISALSITPEDKDRFEAVQLPDELNSEVTYGVITRHDKYKGVLLSSCLDILINETVSPSVIMPGRTAK